MVKFLDETRRSLLFASVLLVIVALWALTGIVAAQSTSVVEINETFGGMESDEANSVIQTSDGGFALVGGSFDAGAADEDAWLIKTDSNGSTEFSQHFDGSSDSEAVSVAQTSDGGFVFVGERSPFGSRHRYSWLVKTGSNGDVEINKTFEVVDLGFDYTRLSTAESVVETSDGGIVLAGHTRPELRDSDAWLIKTDENGNVEFEQTFGGNGFVTSVVETSDGGFALTGGTELSESEEGGAWLIKTDSNGNKQWDSTFVESNNARSVIQTSDGGFALAGFAKGSSELRRTGNARLIKTDEDGNVEFDKSFGGSDFDRMSSVTETSEGGFALAGESESFGLPFGRDMWLIETDEEGNILFSQTFGGRGDDRAYSVIETSDGDLAFGGFTNDFGSGEQNAWLLKISSGNVTIANSSNVDEGTEESESDAVQGTEETDENETQETERLTSVMGSLIATIVIILTAAYGMRRL
jgi:hypothetical protein